MDAPLSSLPPLPLLHPGDAFPPVEEAWGAEQGAPGLLAVGGDLSVETLRAAYSQGIFPWFSDEDPILWWSLDPRMVLRPQDFRLHPSLRRTLKTFVRRPQCEIRVNSAFAQVLAHCAQTPREGQRGTWIVSRMQEAYAQLHEAGYAHSVETWIDGQLVGGLYCVALGRAVYGESMFAHASDASKIALAALVAFCQEQGVAMIDCQQNTRHLASLGAAEIPRREFCAQLLSACAQDALDWHWDKRVLRRFWAQG